MSVSITARLARCTAMSAVAMVLALSLTDGAQAQAVGAVAVPAPPPPPTPPADGEILVTARRREERLQEVPAAVTSISNQTIASAGVQTTDQLTRVTPSLNMPRSGSNLQPMIRGIGTTNSSIGDEPNVAIYLDGVYQPDAIATAFKLSSVQRVEVLRGPQGTLFGRNAAAGAINVITRTPGQDGHAELSLSYGSFNQRIASGYVSSGLGEKFAADLSVYYDKDNGFIHDIIKQQRVGASENFVIRPKLVFSSSDKTTITLGSLYTHVDDATSQLYHPYKGNVSYRGLPAGAALPVPTGDYEIALTDIPFNRVSQYQGYVKLQTEFGDTTFSSQSSATHSRQVNTLDTDYGPLALATSSPNDVSRSYQQEFLLSSNGDSAFTWLVGLFGYDFRARYDPRTTGTSATGLTPFVTTTTVSSLRARSVAPFGEATYKFTDQLSLTAGLRYTYERKNADGTINAGPLFKTHASWDSLTPRAILRYEVPDRFNVYASYSRGFKSGVYNINSPNQLIPVNPETLDAYEVGVKTLMRGPWRASFAGFYYDYQNIQISAFAFPNVILLNAASGKAYGLEGEIHGRLFEGLTLDLFGSYSHTEYSSFPNGVITVPKTTFGNTQVTNVDVSGRPFLRAPKWLGGATLNYKQPIGEGHLLLSGNLYYNGGFAWEITGRVHQPAYALVNASVGYSFHDDHLSVTLWANNLTDKAYAASGNASTFGDNIVYARPRSIGIRLGASY